MSVAVSGNCGAGRLAAFRLRAAAGPSERSQLETARVLPVSGGRGGGRPGPRGEPLTQPDTRSWRNMDVRKRDIAIEK